VGLFGARREVVLFGAMILLARVLPQALHGDLAEASRSAAALLVLTTVCLLTHEVVEKRRRAEQSLRAVLDRLPIGFEIVQDGRIAYANDWVAGHLGIRAEALVGRSVESILHPDERQNLDARIARVFERAPIAPVDRRFLHADGGEVLLQVYPAPLD